MSPFRRVTLQEAVNDEGVSVGGHSRDAIEYSGHGKSILVERSYDNDEMVLYHPPLVSLPAGVPPNEVYEEIIAGAQAMNGGVPARWGDDAPLGT